MKFILILGLLLSFKGKSQCSYEIAKVNNNRTFVVLNSPSNSDKEFIQQLKEVIKDLNQKKIIDLKNEKILISFFNDKKFADYKPETNEMYKEWSQAYIAEYTNFDKKLVIYPMDLKKLKHVILN